MISTPRDRLADGLTYGAMLAIAAFFLLPLLWLLSLAVRTRREIFRGASRFIPNDPTLENFRTILSGAEFPTYLWNGLLISAVAGFGCLLVAAPAAYAFSRLKVPARGLLLMGILAFQMVSPLVIMVPLYRYMNRLGLIDTHLGVILVYIAINLPMCTWLLKGSIDAIPKEVEEAAAMDGCSRFGIFWRITLPLAAPGLASVFILAVIFGWSQFLVPFLLLTENSLLPVAVGIFKYAGSQNASTTQLLAAACLVAVAPAIVAFLVLQRLIVGAITAGAVKG
ncbi:carbohydrate ABC transporter permease [Aureimonas leprariae]|uniref:Maltose/maltodextrin transport system permease protein MalG n=1 Tax=Plantimonas leprariae TaxID=2615207 RepID=A0A7V7PQ83_9HYPH|nr:carbohydrate ABC transporter permease [Aureimonas leprariae]KAB0680252.1 carbohydrate ABC transporter permease [Aureimonas leprariae]